MTLPPRDGLEVPAPPWAWNPAGWHQRVPICVLALVAAALAANLALYQWGLVASVWDPVFGAGSARVLDSEVSHRTQALIGVPDAALGALAYLSDAVFGLAGSTRRWQYRPWLVVLFGIDVIPLGIVSAPRDAPTCRQAAQRVASAAAAAMRDGCPQNVRHARRTLRPRRQTRPRKARPWRPGWR